MEQDNRQLNVAGERSVDGEEDSDVSVATIRDIWVVATPGLGEPPFRWAINYADNSVGSESESKASSPTEGDPVEMSTKYVYIPSHS